jgi:FlaA1/EpsC-like NDP-sugar epimerase
VCGFIDDNAARVANYPEYWVLGRISDLSDVIAKHEPDKVYIAIPSLAGRRRRKIVTVCFDGGIAVHDLMSPHRLRLGWTIEKDVRSLAKQARPVQIEALIGSRSRSLRIHRIGDPEGRPFVIGVGALGTEIARALARGGAEHLMLIDRDPVALRHAEQELEHTLRYPASRITPMCRDIAHGGVAAKALESSTPSIAFFTASWPDSTTADSHPVEAATSEVLTVADAARAAQQAGVARFVHVSKRRGTSTFSDALSALAEAAVLSRATPAMSCMLVRSVPLLESRGSIISLIQDQLRRGGDVSVPAACVAERYLFAADAADLILLAARDMSHRAASQSQTRVFDLVGERLDASEVAHDLARLSGLRPGVDVTIHVDEMPKARVALPAGERHPEDERLVESVTASCSPSGIDGLLDELRELVASGDGLKVHRFALEVEDRLVKVCDLPVP